MQRRSMADVIAGNIIKDHISVVGAKPGDRLPTVRDLERIYATSRTTIVHALGLLEKEGYVVKRHGIGCYVANKAEVNERKLPNLIGFVSAYTDNEVILRIYDGIEPDRKYMT